MLKNVLLYFIIIILLSGLVTEAEAQQPNIVIFLGDDMNWMDAEPYGNNDVITPNISRLAREGMSLDNMFTSTAMCSPSRQQFFTGLYPVRSGAFPNHSLVYDSIKSIVHHLKALGYRAGLIGKKHYGPEGSFPFQYFGGRHHDNGKGQDIDLSKVRSFIQDDSSPYLLVIAQNQPHTPWNRGNSSAYDPQKLKIPPYMVDTERTRNDLVDYYSEITYADSLLGVCLDYIDRSGKDGNTMVIFTSEQGSGFPFAKWTCYDLGLKTSFIIKWPGHISPGTRSNALTQYVDVVPTLLEAVGGNPENIDTGIKEERIPGGFDGRSFLDILLQRSEHHREYVYGVQTTRGIGRGSACYPVRSVRSGRFKYIWNLNHREAFYNMVTANRNSIFYNWLKATEDDPARHNWVKKYMLRPAEELYDLEADPFEMTNIADQPEYDVVKEELRKELEQWMERQGDMGGETEMKALERQERDKEWKAYSGTPCQ